MCPCPAETGEIYHLTFKPPPPEIVPRLVRPGRGGRGRAWRGAAAWLPQGRAVHARTRAEPCTWCGCRMSKRSVCGAGGAGCPCAPLRPPPPAAAHAVQVQRSDDTEEKAVNRLRTYHANVDAVIGYYKQQLVEVRPACCLAWRLARGGMGCAPHAAAARPAVPGCAACALHADAHSLAAPAPTQIDGTQSMEEVFASIQKAIDNAKVVAA